MYIRKEPPKTRTANAAATPCKLRNGNWGAKTSSSIQAGDTVTITTRGGKSWDALVEHVVWTGDGISICATSSVDSRPTQPRSRGTWTGCLCGSVEEHAKPTDCQTCQHDA